MAIFSRPTFGRKKLDFQEVKEVLTQPDSDGVRRVLSKELWEDPDIEKALTDIGLNPDDERNRVRTGEEWLAIFQQAESDMLNRTVEYSREMEARYGYCRAIPFLVIGKSIYNSEHGAFLYGQMDLIGFHDWNVIMCAMDESTHNLCGLPDYPGEEVPVVAEMMFKYVIGWKRRYEFLLESYGVTATGGEGGISRRDFEAMESAIRTEILATVDEIKPKIIAALSRL